MSDTKTLNLRTGDKVTWKLFLIRTVTMVGVVLEDFGDEVVVISHTKNGAPHVQEITIQKKFLKLY
tara:strand:+ start:938 stop:1135 length:198 start_codon:yes stop_codon:yes gene_type:complete